MTLTFLRSSKKSNPIGISLDSKVKRWENNAPAVKSIAANCAVFKNSSRSRSWVTDFKRVVESKSVVY